MKKEVGLLHLAVMLFGLAGVIGKFVTLPAILITFGRVSFSSIFLLIIILIKKEKVRLSNKKDYILIIAAGIVMARHWFTFLQPLVYHEELRIKNIMIALTMFAGVIITIPEFSLNNQITLGIFIGLIGSLSYAVLCLMNRYFAGKYTGRTICLYEQGIAAIILLPSLLIVKASITKLDLFALIFLGVICTAVAHSIYVSSLKKVKVQTAGIISGMESVYSIIFAIFLLHEIPGVKELLGGVIILGVAFYATVTNNKKF